MSYLNNTIENKARNFVLKEIHTTDVLKPVNPTLLVSTFMNPFTGKPYEGLILSGCFAEMDVVNNNSRFYTEENYLPFVEDLKKKILQNNGVFGELEHPENYGTNANNVSHKVIDIWYDKSQKKVFGTILVLNTPKGKIVREIYESGSWLSISARAGGKEINQNDGTSKSNLTLLVTYDIVTHPGFSNASLDKIINPDKLNDEFTVLNESHNFGNEYYSYITYQDTQEKITTEKLFESQNIQVTNISEAKRLSKEEKAEEKADADILEKNEPNSKHNIENSLETAVRAQLKECDNELLKRLAPGAVYDGSAGFKTQGLSGIKNQGQVGLINQNRKYRK